MYINVFQDPTWLALNFNQTSWLLPGITLLGVFPPAANFASHRASGRFFTVIFTPRLAHSSPATLRSRPQAQVWWKPWRNPGMSSPGWWEKDKQPRKWRMGVFRGLVWVFRGSVSPKSNFPVLLTVDQEHQKINTYPSVHHKTINEYEEWTLLKPWSQPKGMWDVHFLVETGKKGKTLGRILPSPWHPFDVPMLLWLSDHLYSQGSQQCPLRRHESKNLKW